MKKPLLAICLSGLSLLATAQQFTLLKDINPGSASSNICYLTSVDNNLFFAATNGVNGMELWKTDGTDAGTIMVKDIKPGASNSSIGYLTQVNHTLFFVANNGTNGTELWRSDGTAAGTVMVKDIRPGSLGSSPSALANFNGTLYFAADDGVNGSELWKSDGTTAGTVMVKDINPFSGSSYPQALVNANGMLYFAADNGTKGTELWKSDGTAAGTVMVKDIWSGANSGYPSGLMNIGSTVYFSASDGVKGTELWKSDGSAAGTVLVKDIWTGSSDSYPFSLRNVRGDLYFSANNGTKGDELWKSDGTSAGTVMVKDIWPGIESGAAGNFTELVSQLVFTGNDGVSGYTTWQSDGTANGTKVASIGSPGDMQELVEMPNNIYASIRQNTMGRELWSINFNSTLPVHLIDFTAVLVNEKDAQLTWKTENEVGADAFIIERSTNGTVNDFTAVGNVKAGNFPGQHDYAFLDRDITKLNSPVVYYRLRQTDLDGHFTYSKVIAIAVTSRYSLRLYPNPAALQANLSILTKRKELLNYKVYDNAGRLVMQDVVQLNAGPNNVVVDVRKLQGGVYFMRLNSPALTQTLQFVKQ